ncbi:unnamed protein product [Caenorhabditis auriculariae]|uniref:Uncharacterized protein n=1 Tax=Caenorhabditis auriculariae TaxID=2777116 RepID=A0A8S1HT00_9PELO|nr:unnamed protein product [Caenorhabditis auriculariae]
MSIGIVSPKGLGKGLAGTWPTFLLYDPKTGVCVEIGCSDDRKLTAGSVPETADAVSFDVGVSPADGTLVAASIFAFRLDTTALFPSKRQHLENLVQNPC